MGKLLFVGSTCADVIINVDRLPRTAEDVVVFGQQMALGGCAFNVFSVARALGAPARLYTPVGTGAFGDFVRAALEAEGVPVPVASDRENGCCYCFVEPQGERTFVAYHGAEYFYRQEWFDAIDVQEINALYACGLEIEDPTGPVVTGFLERCARAGVRIFFTPGPRPVQVPRDLLDRVPDLHPVLHMNGSEAVALAALLAEGVPAFVPADEADPDPVDAAVPAEVAAAIRALRQRTGAPVIATLGAQGCCAAGEDGIIAVPGERVTVVDTIGAGDAHIGAVMACLHRGDSLRDALACANRIAADVVATAGAHLPQATIQAAATR